MEEDHDFTEFEHIKTIYRRALLPWWIWGILLVYLAFKGVFLISDGYSLTQGYVFTFDIFRTAVLLPYPFYPIASVFLYILMLVSALILWLEKKKAAIVGLYCFGLMLALCAAILIKGMFAGHFFLRFEMIIFTDLVLRLSNVRKDWETASVSRYKEAV